MTLPLPDMQVTSDSEITTIPGAKPLMPMPWLQGTTRARLVRGRNTEGQEVVSSKERMFHMKRQWFFVAEVSDKFAFLIYLVTMAFTIIMILYVVPVHMRNDPIMT